MAFFLAMFQANIGAFGVPELKFALQKAPACEENQKIENEIFGREGTTEGFPFPFRPRQMYPPPGSRICTQS